MYLIQIDGWPPRSPNFNPLDFILSGHFKETVYESTNDTEQQLRQKIHHLSEVVKNNENALRSLKRFF